MKLIKLINTLKITTLVILTTLSFTACGDGGSGGSFESDDGTTTGNNSGGSTSGGAIKTIDISIQCATTPTQSDIDSYITLNSGDTISKSGDVTIITYHDSDGIKKAPYK